MENATENKRVWQLLLAITLTALALRLVAVGFLYKNTWNGFANYFLFGFETGRIAYSIVAGHGYRNPLLVETGPTAWMTPVYPYLLAGVFKLFGIYTRNSAFVILSLNSLFSALICIPVFFIARRSFGRSVAIIAAWMWALSPYAIYLASSFVWETCLSALFLAILFLWTLKLKERPGKWEWFGFGISWGVAGLTNPSVLSVSVFVVGWALYPLWQNRKTWLKAALLTAAGLIIVILPWQIRNYRVFHTVVPMRDNFWLEVWVGNDGRTESWADMASHPALNYNELTEFVRVGEIRYLQEKEHQALARIAQHRREFVVMCLRRFVYMWTGFWDFNPRNTSIEFHNPANAFLSVSLTVLMLIGLWEAIRNARRTVLPYLFVLTFFPLAYYVTHPEIRYRHVIEPEIVILAALGARYLYLELVKGFPSLQATARNN